MSGVKKTMTEFKEGKLHSGSKHGPEVKSRAQAIAIGLSEARKAGEKVAPPKKESKMEHKHGHPGEHLHLKEEGTASAAASRRPRPSRRRPNPIGRPPARAVRAMASVMRRTCATAHFA